MTDISEAEIQQKLARLGELRAAIGQAIVGQGAVVEQLLIGLLAGGHCLLEGVPGLGKTLLVRSLGEALKLDFRRVQFTPDLMPSDILGTELLEEDHGTGHRSFRFQKGPIFTNLLLADELNRTPPKTQAALLEAMQERTVSYGGTTYQLPSPFFVLATQNPLEQAGTYPLPDLAQTTGAKPGAVPAVMQGEEVLALQKLVRDVHFGEDLLRWVTRIVRASRPGEGAPEEIRKYVKWGAGPRAGQSLILAAKARALLQGRLAATREDIVALAGPVMRHRLLLSFAAEAEGKSADDVVAALVRAVPLG
ncbi:MAG: AAA family ATPase [Sphingobium sp.]|nr:MAG: AAA family ATPase [Sphingobium sp.]